MSLLAPRVILVRRETDLDRIRASYTLCSYIVIVMTSALLISAGTASAYMAHRYSKNVSSEAVHRGTGAVIMKDQIGTVQHRR